MTRLLQWMAGLTMTLLVYQGNQILSRLDTLERNQTRFFIALGLPPVAADTPIFGVKAALSAPCNQSNQSNQGPYPENPGEFLLDAPAGSLVK